MEVLGGVLHFKSKKIILVIGDSNGVMWEILHNTDYLQNFVFIIPSRNKCIEILASLNESNFLRIYLLNILKDVDLEKFVVSFNGKKCFVSGIKNLRQHISGKQDYIYSHQVFYCNDFCSSSFEGLKPNKLDAFRRVKRDFEDAAIEVIEEIWYWLGEAFELIEDFFAQNWIYLLLRVFGGIITIIGGVALCVVSWVPFDIWYMALGVIFIIFGIFAIVAV